ncbi:unnamed protein product [Caenorhabditis brenneri]
MIIFYFYYQLLYHWNLSNLETLLLHTQSSRVFRSLITSSIGGDQQSLLKSCKQFKHMIKGENRFFESVEFQMSNNSIMLQSNCEI